MGVFMALRLHTESLVQVARDLALQQVQSEFDVEQDDDSLIYFKGPFNITLAGGAVATQVDLPLGATALKYLAVHYVSTSTGINVRLGGAANDPILVKPPTGTDKYGYLEVYTDTASLYVDNPDATATVSATILMGCT